MSRKEAERRRTSKERVRERGGRWIEEGYVSMRVTKVCVSGSRDTLGKQSRNEALVLPGSPSQPGERLG